MREIIQEYDRVVRGVDKEARDAGERAYGGVVRGSKGKLVVGIARRLVELAWDSLGAEAARLSLQPVAVRIPVREGYLERIVDPEVRDYIAAHIREMFYKIKPDVCVHIDGEFRVSVECKAYTENAMFKRILVDSYLLKQVHPHLSFVLIQLESQLGGDFSDISRSVHLGSPPTHTLLSYFDVDISIITLLEGERRVDRPIHKPEFYKPLKLESLERAVERMREVLRRFV